MRLRKKSVSITVGDRALEDLHVRAATQRGRAVAAESRDWLLLKSVMRPGERPRARVAVRFPHEGNAAGFAFVTDQRVVFESRERVTAVALPYVVFVGKPPEPSLGDFAVTARTPGGPSGGELTTTMRIRDAAAFHDFFPTLLDAARAMGALPTVDTSWEGDATPPAAPHESAPGEGAPREAAPHEAGPREAGPGRAAPADPLPTEVVDRALATFMEDDERIGFAAELVCHAGRPVTVLVTQRRLVVVESRLIWAAPIERTKVAEAGGSEPEVRLLAETVTDSLVLGGGLASADSGKRWLTLRSEADPAAGEGLLAHLRAGGAGRLDPRPAAG
ncbi:hypothetical protein SAMN05421678_11859 [Actinopolymorpha cephalotaxi]|uniref:PH domain-containing protein n=1 Tax=Actinopolymorpha cephalotaxi TaxID=504797 RepID=A0A1I3A6A1_9ACTN|nr:hypothetical protein [Actinopolymorpha cephalotaxi]NYH85327.1 hypothetical protein [Actinopolymorpha cephalotaxi]SFH45415.1 hypothetical protein SAMN05421678_11859 [Actinopolymorpha cephalotaxi]